MRGPKTGQATFAPIVVARFWSKVRVVRGNRCWDWQAGKSRGGYGMFHPKHGESVYAHRVAYELAREPIPEGLVIDHLCRNRACVNPDHLEAVTNEENLRRGDGFRLANGRDDSCANGHLYTAANTYTNPKDPSDIRCRECARTREQKRVRNV